MAKTIKIDDEVAAVLRDSAADGNLLRLPARQLDRALYERTNKVLEALGGKWNRAKRAHVFTTPVAGILAAALDDGAVENRQQVLQFFQTPESLADRMADWAVRPGDDVLEPSAGHGRLALAGAVRRRAGSLTCVEIDELNLKTLRGALEPLHPDVAFHLGDFMRWECSRAFGVVLMNPPFSGRSDALHIMRAWDFVRKGGRLCAIASEGPFFGSDCHSKNFRAWIESVGAESEQLPEDTFKREGTGVRTRLIFAEKN